MSNNFTEPPLSDEVWEEIETIAGEAMAGVVVDPEDCLTLTFARTDAIALAEFLAYVAVTYNQLPMIAEQVILAVADWEEENPSADE